MKRLQSWHDAKRIESLFQPWVKRSGLPRMYRVLVKQSEQLGWPFRFGLPDEILMKASGVRAQKNFRRDLRRLERWRLIERAAGTENRAPLYHLYTWEETCIPLPPEKWPHEMTLPISPKIPKEKQILFLKAIKIIEETLKKRIDETTLDLFWNYYRRSGSLSPGEAALLTTCFKRHGPARLRSVLSRNGRTEEYRWIELLEMLLSAAEENPLR